MSASVSLTDHFKRLFEFRGREDRASFWPYAAVAFIITMVVGMIIFVPMMSRSMQAMQQFAAQHPDQARSQAGRGSTQFQFKAITPSSCPLGQWRSSSQSLLGWQSCSSLRLLSDVYMIEESRALGNSCLCPLSSIRRFRCPECSHQPGRRRNPT